MARRPGLTALAAGTGDGQARARALLAGILLLALLVRAWCFVGLASGDPQDDGIYYGHALTLSREGPVYLDRLRVRPADGLYNPVAQFDVRPLVTHPIAATFALFGPGELAATAWPLACSLATVLLAFLIGRDAVDRETGLLAALVCATNPLDTITGTRILSDAPLGATTALALWLVYTAPMRVRPGGWFLAAGVAAGAGCLVNGRGFVIAAAIVALAAVRTWRRRGPRAAPIHCAVGLALVLVAEAAGYAVTTGEPWQNLKIHAGAARFKYRYEQVEAIDLGPVRVHVTNGTPWELTATAFGRRPTAMPLGWVFPSVLAAVGLSLATRRLRALAVFVVALYGYFELGPVSVAFDLEAPRLDYFLVFKQTRFLVVLSAAGAVLIGAAGRRLAARHRWAAVALFAGLVLTSLQAAAQASAFYRSGVADLRRAAAFVEAHPERQFLADSWAATHVAVFSRHKVTNVRPFPPDMTGDDLRGVCVLAGGSRGIELLAAYVESTLSPLARVFVEAEATPPPGWEVALHVPGPRWVMRFRDLRIFCPVARPAISSAR